MPAAPAAEVLLRTLQQALFTHQVPSWDRVLVAYSGGLDSSVLLHGVCRLLQSRETSTPGPALLAVHVNHHIHQDSALWQQHCEATTAAWRVPLISLDADTSATSNVEQAARKARYAAWEALLQAGDLLLLAHHQDDQAETLLYRMLRGRALSGMPRSRELGRGRLLRPLLDLPRTLLQSYAKEETLSWKEDPANEEARFDRNFLRLEVLPVLRRRWPDTARQLASVAERLAKERLMLDEWLHRELCGLSREAPPGTLAALDIAELLTREEGQRIALLRYWLACEGIHEISAARLSEVSSQLSADADRQPRISLNRHFALQRYRQRLLLVAGQERLSLSAGVSKEGFEGFESDRWDLRHARNLTCGKLEAVFVTDAMMKPSSLRPLLLNPDIEALEIRFRQGGERITPAGHRNSKSLKRLFQDAGVPPWQRAGYPLLFSSGKLVAVPGLAVAEREKSHSDSGWQIVWHPSEK